VRCAFWASLSIGIAEPILSDSDAVKKGQSSTAFGFLPGVAGDVAPIDMYVKWTFPVQIGHLSCRDYRP
jgi:hypothetical protein